MVTMTTTSGGSQQSGAPQSGQGVGSPIGNELYNVIAAMHSKLEGLEAMRKYSQVGTSALWQQLSDLDNRAV
jgi:hypothetical protein